MVRFKNYLFNKKAIHDREHAVTVAHRMKHLEDFKVAIKQDDFKTAKKKISIFYDYIEMDHIKYGVPEQILRQAKSRTHFFHGIINSIVFSNYQDDLYAYTLIIVHLDQINAMKNPENALSLTIGILSSYEKFVKYHKSQLQGPYTNKVINYIDEHINQPITLTEIADSLSLNSDYLGRLVKQESGITISALIRRRKIKMSEVYLRHTNKSIAEIAESLGYTDPNYFSKVFKTENNMSPSQYRKNTEVE